MYDDDTRRSGRTPARRWSRAIGVLTTTLGIALASGSGALATSAFAGSHSEPKSTPVRRANLDVLRPGEHAPLPTSAARLRGSGLTLGQAPAGLRSAARRSLGTIESSRSSARVSLPRPRSVKAESQFGISIAISGDTALVGAPTAGGGFGQGTGAVYVFVKEPTGWTQQARLRASDAAPGDLFGAAVAVDGDTAVIGAQNKGEFFGGIGAAYVFVRSGSTWKERAELTAQCPSCGRTGDFFGWAVGVSGNTVLVSAPGFDSSQGAVFQFTRAGKKWTQTDMFDGSDSAPEDAFGWSLSLSGDTAVIGAPRGFGGVHPGAAYVFVNDGTHFVQQQELAPLNRQAGDLFGTSVAVSGDTVLVGAPGCCQSGGHDFLGNADVFVRNGDVWTQQAQLTASDGAGGPLGGDEFGKAVALSGDTALIGAEDKDASTGEAYEDVRSGSTWTETSRFTDATGAVNDEFGHAVAIHHNTALISSPHHDHARGQVLLFPL